MAFDLKTAKPVSGGFDLRTAKPVAAPSLSKDLQRRQAEIDAELKRRQRQIEEDRRKAEAARAAPQSFFDLLVRGVTGGAQEEPGVRDDARAFEARAAANRQAMEALQRERRFIEEQGRAVPKLTTTGRIREAAKALPAQAIRSAGQIAGAAGVVPGVGEEFTKRVEKGAEDIVTGLGLKESEEVQFDPTQQAISGVTGGIGSLLPYVTTELFGRGAARGLRAVEAARAADVAQKVARGAQYTLGAGQGAAQQRQQIEKFEQETGQTVSPIRRSLTQLGGAAIGLTEALPIPGMAQTGIANIAAEGLINRVVKSAIEEGAQEGGSQLAQNVIETAGYNPEKVTNLGDQVLENAALGAITGGLVSTATGGVQRLAEQRAAPPPPPPPPPGAEGEPIRTTTVAFENKEDPANPTIRTFDVMSEPDEDGLVTVRDETGRAFEITAARLGEQEALAEAYAAPAAAPALTPTVEPTAIMERLRLASGVPEGQKEPGRVTGLAREITDALSSDDDVTATAAVQARVNALAGSRMSETTRAQRQAELDEAQSIINDYRAERGLARAAPAARVEAPTVEPDTIAQALAQNEELAREDAARAAEERARLERESALESASLIGQASPIRQAQTERQQLFDAIINDDTIENPAAAFRQVLRERGYPNTELNEAERRQVQAKLAFTQPEAAPVIAEEPVAPPTEEVPAAPPAAPPEAAAGTPAAEPGAPAAVAFGEEPALTPAAKPSKPVFSLNQDAAETAIENPQIDTETLGLLQQATAVTGTEEIIQALRQAAADGQISQEAAELTIWFLERNPNVARYASMYISDYTGQSYDGSYNPLERLIEIVSGSEKKTGTHEFLHHAERLMPESAQRLIEKVWAARLKINRLASSGREKAFFDYLYNFYFGDGNPADFASASYIFRNGGVPRSFYQFMTPSEYWAENASEIVAARYGARDSAMAQLKQWLKELASQISSFFGIPTNAPLIRELNKLAKSTGEAKAPALIMGAEGPAFMYAGRSIIEPREGDDAATAAERDLLRQDYEVAQDMEQRGDDAVTIRVATGWERNPYDNEWRYLQADDRAQETRLLDDLISDYDSATDLNELARDKDGAYSLSDLVSHSELYGIYPNAANIPVYVEDVSPDGTQAFYDPATDSITLYADATDPLGSLLHEIQHWVQDKEGFPTGSSSGTVWLKLSDEQKIKEAQIAEAILADDIDNQEGALELISWLRKSPEFKAMVRDGTADEGLQQLFEEYFFANPGASETSIDIVESAIQTLREEADAAGLVPTPLNINTLSALTSRINGELNTNRSALADIQSGDVTADGSTAAKAARYAFENVTRRNTQRYLDTAGEIEARDVAASKGKTREQLREAGTLSTERKVRPEEVVISRRPQGISASIAPQPNVPAEPEPAKMSRLRELYNRIRIGKAWSNIGSQFSGARAADQWLARSLGLKKMPDTDSFYSAFETFLSKKNGMLQRLRLDYVDPLTDAISDAIKNGVTLDMLNDYIQARGAAERNAEIAKINKDMPDGGSGITDARAEEMLLELELSGKMRDILRVAKLHDRLRDRTQQLMVESGLVSAETMADWKKKYPNYTPYKGWAPAGDMTVDGQEDPHADYGAYEGGQPVYSRVAGTRAKPVKKAKGRSSQAANSIYNMIADAEMFLEMGQRNEISLKFEEAYQKDPAAFEGLMKVYDEKHPKIIKGKAQKITDESAYKQAVRGFKKGKPFIMEMAPNEEGNAVYRAFQNLNAVQLAGWVQKFLSIMSVMRGVHTRFNAAFWPREFLRSVSDAAGNVFAERGRKNSAAYGKKAAMKTWAYSWDPTVMAGVFSHLVNRTPENERVSFIKMLTDEMVENGGAAGQEFAQRAERVAARMEAELKRLTATGVKAGYFETKEGLNKLMKGVDGINDFVDLVPRVAAYKALTEAGLTPQQAAPIALRSTLDLTKRGRFGQVIDGIFWWTTPSLTNLTNKISKLDSSTYRKLLVAQLAVGFGLGMLNVMNAPDSDDDGEDDYSQMPEWRKLAYLHVYYSPDEKPFTLPVGFLFMFERYVGGKMAEVLMGKTSDGKAAVDVMTAAQQIGTAFLSSLSPVVRSTEARTLVPSSIAPMYDLAVNESFFKSPIYMESKFNEEEAKASRAKPSTPEFYKFIARQIQERTGGYGRIAGDLDVSPDQLKYFVDQYSGGVGRLVGGAANADVEALKKLNPFYFDPKLTEYSPMSRFYERDGEMKNAIAAKKLDEEGDSGELEFLENTKPYTVDDTVIEAYKTAEKDLKELRKEDIPFEEYNARRLEIMAKFNEAYNDAKGREQ